MSASAAADAKAAQRETTGVNLDEEAARLIQFQQSYQAAAKMLQVAQSVFDTLLQTAGALTRPTATLDRHRRTRPCASAPPTPSTPRLDALTRAAGRAVEAQVQLTTGKRVNRASDDPAAAARGRTRAVQVERAPTPSQRAVDASRNMMTLTEGALGEAGELLQQAREALVAAGNATYSDAERMGLAQKIAGLREQLLAVANRSDGAGSYLFGGQGASQPPFVDAPGGVQFRGDRRARSRPPARTGLPLSADGQLGLDAGAHRQRRVRDPAATSTGTAWIDAGQVTRAHRADRQHLQLQFSINAGVTTYAVLQDGTATALTDVPYTTGKAIEVDGMSVTINGRPGRTATSSRWRRRRRR